MNLDRISAVAFLAGAVMLAACGETGNHATDTAHGRQLADQLCSKCHRVGQDQPVATSARVVAPPFWTIAKQPGTDAPSLSRFTLHLPMGVYQVTAQDRDDIVAYILSLR